MILCDSVRYVAQSRSVSLLPGEQILVLNLPDIIHYIFCGRFFSKVCYFRALEGVPRWSLGASANPLFESAPSLPHVIRLLRWPEEREHM